MFVAPFSSLFSPRPQRLCVESHPLFALPCLHASLPRCLVTETVLLTLTPHFPRFHCASIKLLFPDASTPSMCTVNLSSPWREIVSCFTTPLSFALSNTICEPVTLANRNVMPLSPCHRADPPR